MNNSSLGGRLAVLDVRGTLLDGQQDTDINYALLNEITSCLQNGIAVAMLSGCSRETIEQLILQPWKVTMQSDAAYRLEGGADFYIYTENGCHGFKADSHLNLSELDDYEHRLFDEAIRSRVCQLLTEIDEGLGLTADIQNRSGQINFYLDADYDKRIVLAKMFAALFRDENLPLKVVVPSSKDVIDISLGSKTDALADLIPRLGILNFANVLAVSDSFQNGGADSSIAEALSGARLVHVGPTDMDVPDNVLKVGRGPQGTAEILAGWRGTPCLITVSLEG